MFLEGNVNGTVPSPFGTERLEFSNSSLVITQERFQVL